MAQIQPGDLERLQRIAAADGYTVRRAPSRAHAARWGGKLAVFAGDAFRFATHDAEALRGWLHVNATPRP